ncbi:cytochrome c oxidase subunit 6C-like [Diorhabda carinulata]|uniref:cytochrome c oxidase subunit 6C-like n=1 Tax=Diorhabda carinulata TaxID=1163345 RepID=UPI0025A25828|nr:cytochrome c oxidase subunit 6C-like [Diorhabda carinulata]
MSELPERIPKPQMRGLLHSLIKKNLILTGISVLIAGGYMRFVYGDGNKRAYANFYLNYDAEKEFHTMRKKGLFDSCDPDDDE